MNPPDISDLACLALAWALWCGVHSLLLWTPLRDRLEAQLGWRTSVYRVWYSVLSVITLAPVVWYTWVLGGITPYLWPGWWLAPQAVLIAAGVGLLLWANHDFEEGGVDLLGVEEARAGQDHPQVLVESGAYGLTRHPMHVAAFILVWARTQAPADLVVSLLLTLYVYLGSLHEESRLKAQFGPAYRAYMARVPLIPFWPVGPKRG